MVFELKICRFCSGSEILYLDFGANRISSLGGSILIRDDRLLESTDSLFERDFLAIFRTLLLWKSSELIGVVELLKRPKKLKLFNYYRSGTYKV